MKTSFSSAFLQIGSRCERQKARLHIVHVAAGARISRRGGLFGGGELEERRMMVLLVKHVHLQNDGGDAATTDMMSANKAMMKRVNRAILGFNDRPEFSQKV